MAGKKITELDELTGNNADSDDLLVIVDESENKTKKIRYGALIESNIDSADHARNSITADVAKRIRLNVSVDNTFDNAILFRGGVTGGVDSVAYDVGITVNPFSNRIKALGGFEGIADSALNADRADVADSANFNLTSINDVTDTFSGLVTGQVLKYDGDKWTNQNDNTGDLGEGVVAKKIITKSADNLNAEFLVPLVSQVGADSVDVDNEITYNPSTNTLTTTNFSGTASNATLATLATTAIDTKNLIADSVPASGTLYPIMRLNKDPGADSANTTVNLSYTLSGSGDILAAPKFSGDGSAVTNVAASSATNASNVAITNSSTSATTQYVHFGEEASGNGPVRIDTALQYAPDSDKLTVLAVSTANGYTFHDSASNLVVSYNGLNIFRLDSVGNMSIAGTLSQSQNL